MQRFVHSLWVAEYDGEGGSKIIFGHPFTDPSDVLGIDSVTLANLCIPDGAQHYQSDQTFLILTPKASTANEESGSPEHLYGISFFMRTSATAAAAAASAATPNKGHRALLALLMVPAFSVLKPLLGLTLSLNATDPTNLGLFNSVELIYTQLDARAESIAVSELAPAAKMPMQYPDASSREFQGASLTSLVKHFKEDTMYIWLGILLKKRVLFVGQPASDVGFCVLASTLLVSPLINFDSCLFPYVSSSNTSVLQRSHYISGMTNYLFESKIDMADIICSFSSGVQVSYLNGRALPKMSLADKEHIKNVLSGIEDNKGEQWVRDQFRLYTLRLLQSVDGGRLNKVQRTQFPGFQKTELFEQYVARKAELQRLQPQDNLLETLVQQYRALTTTAAADAPTLPTISPEEAESREDELNKHRCRILFDMTKELENLSSIDAACEADAVSLLADGLKSSSSQLRKYSAAVLCQLAISTKGQMRIIASPHLATIINLLADDMPNVVKAAVFCLMKVSTLFTGVQRLLALDCVPHLVRVMSLRDLETKTGQRCATTLLQIYRFAPKPEPEFVARVRSVVDSLRDTEVRGSLLDLLDWWDEDVTDLVPEHTSPEVISSWMNRVGKTVDFADRAIACQQMISFLVNEPRLTLFQFVKAGLVELLSENIRLCSGTRDHPLARFSLQMCTFLIDTHLASLRVSRLQWIAQLNKLLRESDAHLYLFFVMRFLEFAASKTVLRTDMMNFDVHSSIIQYIKKEMYDDDLVAVCTTGVRVLLALLRHLRGDERREFALSLHALDTCEAAMRKALESRKPEDGRMLHADEFLTYIDDIRKLISST